MLHLLSTASPYLVFRRRLANPGGRIETDRAKSFRRETNLFIHSPRSNSESKHYIPTMRTLTLAAAALLAATGAMAQGSPTSVAVQSPSAVPKVGEKTPQGCFSAPGNLVKYPNLPFNSQGSCVGYCTVNITATSVAATHGPDCYCGNAYPPEAALVDDSNCNYPCPGYPLEACPYLPPRDVINVC